jgi:hypothetical protein
MAVVMTRTLGALMTEIVALEEQIHEDLTVYRWQPLQPNLPAVWNWIASAPFEQRDLTRWRDTFEVLVRVGIRHTDVEQHMDRFEIYVDSARDVIDMALAEPGFPFAGTAREAHRTGMRSTSIDFGSFSALVIEFPIQVRQDRQLR